MKVIDNLRRKLESIGATLDEGMGYTLNCDAPSGYVWRANGCRTIAIQCATNSQSWYSEAINKDGLPRLQMGLEKVIDLKELESHRFELDEPDWGASLDVPLTIDWPK